MVAPTDSAHDPIAADIWDMKYRLKEPDGTPIDNTIEDTWRRVASAVAGAEPPRTAPAGQALFIELLAGYRFLPAGRILSGAGSQRNVTLFNCFVMGDIEDIVAGIFRD